MRLGWAVSGRGMAARAVVEANRIGLLDVGLSFVLLDRPSEMQNFCQFHSIPLWISSAADVNNRLIRAKQEFELNWLGLTFNRILKPVVLTAYEHRIFNLHMAALPAFPGLNATRNALKSGVSETGVTVHYVDEGIDTGPIIAQTRCPILPDDSERTLGRRQFELAVPLLLQTVRNASRAELDLFSAIDQDIIEFSKAWCADNPPAE